MAALIVGAALAIAGERDVQFVGIALVIFAPLIFVALFVWRRDDLADDKTRRRMKAEGRQFEDFSPEGTLDAAASGSGTDNAPSTLESQRIRRYEEQEGLFLVHSWRPSEEDGYVDVRISLREHRNPDGSPGPIERGAIRSVEYTLGQRFAGGRSIFKQDPSDSFRLDITAYAPALCLARVRFHDDQTLLLQRYLDFET